MGGDRLRSIAGGKGRGQSARVEARRHGPGGCRNQGGISVGVRFLVVRKSFRTVLLEFGCAGRLQAVPGAEQPDLDVAARACCGMGCDVQSQVCEGRLPQGLSWTQEHQHDATGFHRQLQATHHGRCAAMEPCKDHFHATAAGRLFERPEGLTVF